MSSTSPDRQAAELGILQRIATTINATLDLQEIYDIALRTLGELFEFNHSIILLVEPDGEWLRVVASRGYENQAIGGRVRIGVGAIGQVAQKRRILQLGHLGQQRVYAAAQRRQMMKEGRGGEIGDVVPIPGLPNAESQIAIPLLIRDELIGVFSIESPVHHTFKEHDRDLISIVANQTASAIRNAQLYDERKRAAEALQDANASLEARVAERTAALRRELRVAQELVSDARSRVEGPLIGDSAPVRLLRNAVDQIAMLDEPLLLTGPPGAGKEAVAYAVHAASKRTGAFIFVSCPELHTPLRHAMDGDTSQVHCDDSLLLKKVELAGGGTLFLEAVHELPTEIRAALKKLLLDHARSRAGGEPPAPDVRVIASSVHVEDPTGEIDGLTDLFTRRIAVPPLADRREDIPALVAHFLRRLARQFGKAVDGVSSDSMRRLQQYAWPGNIRELRTVLERAVLVSKSTIIDVDEELLDERLAAGSYRLVSKLGSGGMGEVWLGKHRLLARPAAVKLIRNDSRGGGPRDQLVRRFQREAQVTARLRSPHTVQLYDFGVNESGSFYYVMELLDGLDLQHIVTRFGPQPAERLIMLLVQACRSLGEAHDRGLVHRDIKPANLFVARLGAEYDYLKVLDFGIVKDQPDAGSISLTTQGILQGTPAFMAPETIFGDESFDGRADLYSLACATYWALTNRMVFQAATPQQMLLHHAQTTPIRPSEVSEIPIPRDFENVLMMCLEKDPARRPASAHELGERLARLRVEPWTQTAAREWWETHAPDIVSRTD